MADIQNNKNENDEMVLVNALESIVKEKAKELFKTFDICQCRKCYLDVCAITLNSLRPHYITTEKGKMFSHLSTFNYGYQAQLTAEIMKALEKVKQKPGHE